MIESICRICLNSFADTLEMCNIFLAENKVMVSTKIMLVAKVKVYPEDGLPSVICLKCLSMLDKCLDFISLCQVSDQKLRNERLEQIKNQNDTLSSISHNESIKIEMNSDDGAEIYENKPKIINQQKRNIITKKTGNKQQCSICGRVMSSTYRLKTHLATHTEERPFFCPHCSKSFSLSENLKVHLRIHTGEKPLSCVICGQSFAQSAGLVAHRRKHSGQMPYKCKLCSRSFRTFGHFQYHTKRHTGEKKYECDTCDKRFITRGDLKQHISTHTGDRPHICTICGLRLTRASNLRRHMQQLHHRLNNMPTDGRTKDKAAHHSANSGQ